MSHALHPRRHPQRLALPESIILVSFQKEPITNLDYCVGEGVGRLLRKIVSRIDDAVFVQPDEHAGVLCGPTGLERVGRAVDRHRRHLHRGLLRQKVFEMFQPGIARLKAEGAAVTMDHDIHEVGIFESDRRPSECRFIELPAGRPLAPQDPAQFAAVFGQAFASAFGLEEMLIPVDALKRWCDGMPLSTHIDHVVARV
jgi:hypothetical protein